MHDRDSAVGPAASKLPAAVRRYLASSYPHNHNYRVIAGRLWPNGQLRRRFRRIARLYPDPLRSLVDLSVSKGYFALRAALDREDPVDGGLENRLEAVGRLLCVSIHREQG